MNFMNIIWSKKTTAMLDLERIDKKLQRILEEQTDESAANWLMMKRFGKQVEQWGEGEFDFKAEVIDKFQATSINPHCEEVSVQVSVVYTGENEEFLSQAA